MRILTNGWRSSMGEWLLWGLGIYLALETGPFILFGFALKKTTAELAGPYFACAVPAVVFMPLIWWLKKWERQGASPNRLARGWGLSMALFGVTVIAAVLYSGVKLGLMDPRYAIGTIVLSVLLSVPISYFGMHQMVLRQLSSRALAGGGRGRDGASSSN